MRFKYDERMEKLQLPVMRVVRSSRVMRSMRVMRSEAE
jgi:hypothetical protein